MTIARRFTAAVLALLSLRAVQGLGASGVVLDRASYDLHPALEMQLWAAEPDVVDPVAMCFDANGRAYVVEMRDYPTGMPPDGRPGGTIRLLEGMNADGKPERATLFATGLRFPTSITPWRGGVLVAAPPQILWLKDTNRDGVADTREVVLDGFHAGVTDSNVNGLRYGLDNLIHGLNGGNGGMVFSPRQPSRRVPLQSSDFSFQPDTGDIGVTFQASGGFGLVFDEWGRSFVTHNVNHIQQRFVARRYTSKAAGLPAVALTGSISDHDEMARIHPVSTPQTRPNHPEQAGHFSSAGGMGIIPAAGFPRGMAGNVLVCDAAANVVHRDVLKLDGPMFRAARAVEEVDREFFASRDPACRPVGLETGPDGALYLLDMQRDTIEHPDYIPEKTRAQLDLRAGQNRGRIYRITPKGGLPPVRPQLETAPVPDLVNALGHANSWIRITAQRLLVERNATAAVPLLRQMARATVVQELNVRGSAAQRTQMAIVEQGAPALARLHALWTLQGIGALEESDVRNALIDGEPGVRENAALLAERFLPTPDGVLLRKRLTDLAFDSSPRVRFQAALAMGSIDGPECFASLHHLIHSDYGQPWMRFAVWTALGFHVRPIISALLEESSWREGYGEERMHAWQELAELVGARASQYPEDAEFLIQRLDGGVSERYRIAIAQGLANGILRAGSKPAFSSPARAAIQRLALGGTLANARAAWQLARILNIPDSYAQKRMLSSALDRARDPALPPDVRADNLRLLEFGDPESSIEKIVPLLDGTQPAPVQLAALEAIRGIDDPALARMVIRRWKFCSPAIRPRLIHLLLSRRAFHESVVEAIESKALGLGELNLDLEQRRVLLRSDNAALQQRAARLLGDEEYSHRKSVVAEWLGKLPAQGDPEKGKPLFEQLCSPCHRTGGMGFKVGPDLSDVSHRSVEDLISHILDPNMAINPAYIAYTAETRSGGIETGILLSETTDTVVLVQAMGKRLTLARKDLVRLESSGQSLMPEGLEAGRTPQDLRDLITFLHQQGRNSRRKP